MRLTKVKDSTHAEWSGTITVADLRKKFNIPDDAEITITLPFIDYDNRGDTFIFGDSKNDEVIHQIDVTVERIK